MNTGLIIRHRTCRRGPLLSSEEADHAEHRGVRAGVEHNFARLKNYKGDFRHRRDGLFLI